jgi:hypothetical protein
MTHPSTQAFRSNDVYMRGENPINVSQVLKGGGFDV